MNKLRQFYELICFGEDILLQSSKLKFHAVNDYLDMQV